MNLNNNDPELDRKKLEDENIFGKVHIRPLIAANCTDFVVAHSKAALRPVRQVSEVFMMPHILDVMHKLGLNKVLRVQSHTWRHLIVDRSHGAMVVAAPRSGRTFSYIPAVCDVVGRTILEDRAGGQRYENLPGPLALILVADLDRVRRVSALCYAFLRNVPHSMTYSVVLNVPSTTNPEFFHRIFCGIGCLVATPAQLVWAMDQGCELPLRHLKVIVYDDIDLLDPEKLKQADRELSKLMRVGDPQPQVVMVSQKYDHSQMARLKQLNSNPALIFGDMLEAAMYGGMRLQIALRTAHEKVTEVLKLLELRSPKDYRTVVFCNSDADMRRLVGLLEEVHLYSCLPYYQNANLDVAEQVHSWLADTSGIILLVTDNCPELSIRYAHTVIHYSMSSSWGRFKMRHLALSGNLVNKLDSDPSRRVNAVQLYSLVLLDDTNQSQLPRLVDFVQKFQAVDDAIVVVAKQIRQHLVSLDQNQNVVCRQTMMLGDCINTACVERHYAGKMDRPTGLVPVSGDIKFLLARVYSPTHFCVYLVEHLAPGQSWKKYPSLAVKQMRLKLMQGESNERYWPPVAGAVCLYRVDEHKIRVRVLKVEPIENVNLSVNNLDVLVQAMDEDTRILSVKSGRLYKCPEELQAQPPMAIDLRLFGMVPFSGERGWFEEDRRAIEKQLKGLPDDCFLQANIQFATAHTIFIRNLKVIFYSRAIKMHLPRLSLNQHLAETRMAKSCQEAKNKLLEFFEDAITTVVEPDQLKSKPKDEPDMKVEEQLKEEAKENAPPNKPVLKVNPFEGIQLGLEYVGRGIKPREEQQQQLLKEEQASNKLQAKNLEQQANEQQPKAQENNESLKQLMECIKNIAALQVEDALGTSDEEDHKQMLVGASKLLDHMEYGPETSQGGSGNPDKSRKRKSTKYATDFKVTPARDPTMQLVAPPDVVRPPTTYYQTRTTLELHVLLPDDNYQYSALLADNHVFFHATHPSSGLRHQFVLPMGVPYSCLEHYMRGRTVYMSVKKTLGISDPLSFVQHHSFLKPNHEKFAEMDKNPQEKWEKFANHDQKMANWAAKYLEDENNNSSDEDHNLDGVERVDKYEHYED